MFTERRAQLLTPNKVPMKNLALILILMFGYSISTFASTVIKLNATYTIPTDSEADLPYSTYHLENYQVAFTSLQGVDVVTVTYSMPELMVGESQEISMILKLEDNGIKYLEGENSIAICSGKWVAMRCDVRFNGISVDLFKIKNKLEAANVDPLEISKRISILSKFSGDPIGVSQTVSY